MIQHYLTTLLAALALTLTVACTQAADKNKAYDTPEAAAKDPDFAIQGEYVGMVSDGGATDKVGIQIIALGGGKFHGVAYEGGLPGAGWNGADKHEAKGQTDADGKTVFVDEQGRQAVVKTGKLELFTADGELFGEAAKVARQSPTLGQKPPKGAVVLFDGSEESLANWKKGARMTDDGLLMQGVTSKPTFGDMTVHVEFRLPFKPHARGQGRGNSGLYLQGRYEVQMLDSFGLKGNHNECGGIYSIKPPDLNMALPPLTWQTYDIDFTAAKFDDSGKKVADAVMTVRHNGVVIHKDVKLPKTTTAAPVKLGPKPGPIYLQNHGNPVRYRNIWVAPR